MSLSDLSEWALSLSRPENLFSLQLDRHSQLPSLRDDVRGEIPHSGHRGSGLGSNPWLRQQVRFLLRTPWVFNSIPLLSEFIQLICLIGVKRRTQEYLTYRTIASIIRKPVSYSLI